jgi:hypothetical protein
LTRLNRLDESSFGTNPAVVVDKTRTPPSLLDSLDNQPDSGVHMELLGAEQVSEMIGVPVGTLRYWRHSDIGPASFTLGRRVVYRRDEVLRWISERENATRRGGGDAA